MSKVYHFDESIADGEKIGSLVRRELPVSHYNPYIVYLNDA